MFGLPWRPYSNPARAPLARRIAILILYRLVKILNEYTWLHSAVGMVLAYHEIASGSRPPLVNTVLFFYFT